MLDKKQLQADAALLTDAAKGGYEWVARDILKSWTSSAILDGGKRVSEIVINAKREAFKSAMAGGHAMIVHDLCLHSPPISGPQLIPHLLDACATGKGQMVAMLFAVDTHGAFSDPVIDLALSRSSKTMQELIGSCLRDQTVAIEAAPRAMAKLGLADVLAKAAPAQVAVAAL